MASRPAVRTAALVLALVVTASCATITPGSNAVIVRGQDVLSNSLALYGEVMKVHMAHSAEESPALYRALETVRVSFPPAHRGLANALDIYKASDQKDASGLRFAVNKFLDEAESWAPWESGWAVGVRLLKAAWNGGGA